MANGSRRVVLVCVSIVAFAAAAFAQTDVCVRRAQPLISWFGQSTDCSRYADIACAKGESIEFAPYAFFGYPYQACDRFTWRFSDGAIRSRARVVHVFAPEDQAQGVIRLQGTPGHVMRGQSVVLSSKTSFATQVRIEPLNVMLNNAENVSYTFVPQQTATYTLVAFGEAGIRVSDRVTVTVVSARGHAARH